MAIIDIKNCTFRIEGGGANERVTIKLGEGTVSWTERKNREYLLDRGTIDTVRNGDQVPVDVSFQFRWIFLKSSDATPSIKEALTQTGAAAAWTSSATDTCEPYAVDITIVHTPICAGETIERITLPDFRYEELQHDVKAGIISVSGKCNAQAITVVRGNQYS